MAEDRVFSLDSGAKLIVGPAPFVDAKRLHDKIMHAVIGKELGGVDLKELLSKNKSAIGSTLMDAVMRVASDPEVESAIFECGVRALYSYDGSETSRTKVTKSLFDDPKVGEKAREDLYPICLHIMEVNVKPFLKAIFSLLEAHLGKIADIQKSTLESMTQPQ